MDRGYDNGSEPVAETGFEFAGDAEPFLPENPSLNGSEEKAVVELEGDDEPAGERSDAFDEIDYGREFQDYLDPGYRTQEIE